MGRFKLILILTVTCAGCGSTPRFTDRDYDEARSVPLTSGNVFSKLGHVPPHASRNVVERPRDRDQPILDASGFVVVGSITVLLNSDYERNIEERKREAISIVVE